MERRTAGGEPRGSTSPAATPQQGPDLEAMITGILERRDKQQQEGSTVESLKAEVKKLQDAASRAGHRWFDPFSPWSG